MEKGAGRLRPGHLSPVCEICNDGTSGSRDALPYELHTDYELEFMLQRDKTRALFRFLSVRAR